MKNNNVLNKKAVLVSLSLLFIVIIVAVTSFANAGINPDYWKSTKFITDMIFTVSLVLIGTVVGHAEGDNYYRNRKTGLFQQSYNAYDVKRKKIDNYVDKFSHWNKHLYEKEYYNKCIRFLQSYGIKQADLIIRLDRLDVITLENMPKSFFIDGKERYFNSLTKVQINAILYVLDGKVKMRYVNDGYFLNAFSKNKNHTMYEQASVQDRTKRRKFMFLMTYRIVFTVLIGMVLTSLIVDTKSGEDTAQAVINLFSRYFTLFSSVAWGFFIASDMLKDECIFLDYKATVLEQFYLEVEVNHTFNAKTEEDLAYEEINKLMKGDGNNATISN